MIDVWRSLFNQDLEGRVRLGAENTVLAEFYVDMVRNTKLGVCLLEPRSFIWFFDA
jgi:hypothetical protein